MTLASPIDECLRRLVPEDAPALLLRFARYWLERRRGRAMPDFADLDPTDLPWALPLIFVIARRADGVPYYRLVGEEMAQALGSSLVNKTAYDVFERGYAQTLDRRWRRCFDEPAACFVHSSHERRDGVPLQARRVLLPLGEDSGAATRLIGLSAFDQPDFQARPAGQIEAELPVRWTPIAELPRT